MTDRRILPYHRGEVLGELPARHPTGTPANATSSIDGHDGDADTSTEPKQATTSEDSASRKCCCRTS